MKWWLVTFSLCSYGFWKELRPGVPFLTPFLVSPPKNFTDEALYSQVYPYWTYSYLIALLPVFILTDVLRYKPVVVLEAACLIATWCLLIWAESIAVLQIMQVMFGVASACEVAYYSYIYAAVPPSRFAQVTSYVRAVTLFGRCAAYTASQVVISLWIGNYLLLNYISLVCLCVCLSFALILPKVNSSLPKSDIDIDLPGRSEETHSHIVQSESHNLSRTETAEKLMAPEKDVDIKEEQFLEMERELPVNKGLREYLKGMLRLGVQAYSDWNVVKWSLWWALATCGSLQIGNYIQNLWALMQSDQSTVFNGLIEAVNTLAGGLFALIAQFVHLKWAGGDELLLSVTSVIQAVLVGLCGRTEYLWVAYLLYVMHNLAYQLMITIATANVARNLLGSSYGLVIGCNTFVALSLQTALTIAVADHRGFNLHIRTQFFVYAMYFACIGVLYGCIGLLTCIMQYTQSTTTHPHQQQEISK